jgi:hypothetical protein
LAFEYLNVTQLHFSLGKCAETSVIVAVLFELSA